MTMIGKLGKTGMLKNEGALQQQMKRNPNRDGRYGTGNGPEDVAADGRYGRRSAGECTGRPNEETGWKVSVYVYVCVVGEAGWGGKHFVFSFWFFMLSVSTQCLTLSVIF